MLLNIGNVVSDIRSQQANRAGDFALANSADQRNWMNSLSGAGRASDLSGMGAFGSNLEGLGTYGSLAMGAGNQDLARDAFGFDVASGVELGRLVKSAYQQQIDQGLIDRSILKTLVLKKREN